MTLRAELEAALLALGDVELRPSRFGGDTAFWIAGREFAHFHRGNEIDLRLTKPEVRRLRSELKADPKAEISGGGDWVAYRFPRRAAMERALELAVLAMRANGP